MTSQLHKKHPITRPNIGPAISRSTTHRSPLRGLTQLACCGAVLLSLTVESFAASSASQLRWGRPAVAVAVAKVPNAKVTHAGVTNPKATSAKVAKKTKETTAVKIALQLTAQKQTPVTKLLPISVIRDASVMHASWDDMGDGSQVCQVDVQSPVTQDRSIVVGHPGSGYDPFEEDDRLAQLPADTSDDDLFDEPTDEPIEMPEPDQSPFNQGPMDDEATEKGPAENDSEDIDSAQEAIDAELERRRAEENAFGEEIPDEGTAGEELMDRDIEDSIQSETPGLFEGNQTEGNESPAEIAAPGDEAKPKDFNLELGGTDRLDEHPVDVIGEPHTDRSEDTFLPEADEPEARDENLDYEDRLTPEEQEERRLELEVERLESIENCRKEFTEMKADLISSIDLSIRVEGTPGEDFPFACAAGNKLYTPRQWPEITYNWKAAAICHKPLYFEQVQLERYGHSWGPFVQPIMSGAHFFGTLPILPYKMGIRAPNECVYTLGYYRPGSCAPFMIDPIPFTWRAAFFQGGAVTGLSFIIP